MANLLDLTASIVSSHVSNTQMSSDDMLKEIEKVFATLKAIEDGTTPQAEQKPQLSVKQAFKKNEVVCLICGKGFKTLKRHLAQAHDMKPGQYRKQFNIPSSQPLVAKSYSEERKKAALDRGLGDNLAKARAARATGKRAVTAQKAVKAAKPANASTAAPVPVVKTKAAVPALKAIATVPAVKKQAALPVKATDAPKAIKAASK